MGWFILRRLVIFIPTLLVASLAIFILMRTAIGGDPVLYMMGREATLARAAKVRQTLGLDRPIAVQYVDWLGRVVVGDLGRSFEYPMDVRATVFERLPATLELTALATVLALLVAVPVGVVSAVARHTAFGRFIGASTVAGICVPNFWLGLLLIYLFSVELGWLPSSGYVPPRDGWRQNLASMVLPTISLAAWYAAAWARYVRSALIEVLQAEYIRVARAKGLFERTVLYRHALRNALIPVVTIVGQNVPFMLAGAVAVETVFSVPGVGRLFSDAVLARDYPVIQGDVLFLTLAVAASSLIVDVSYVLLDPRIRYEG